MRSVLGVRPDHLDRRLQQASALTFAHVPRWIPALAEIIPEI
jgi:hypothetical protein